VFVYRCENVAIIGFIISVCLLRLWGNRESYIKQLTGKGRRVFYGILNIFKSVLMTGVSV